MTTSKVIKHFRLPPMPSLSDIVKLYKLKAIRQLSQNFLLDKNINDRIIRSSKITKNSIKLFLIKDKKKLKLLNRLRM